MLFRSPVEPVPHATVLTKDFYDDDAPAVLKDLLGGQADVVLSDMAAAATGDWLVFIDADSHPSPALFEYVAACMADGRTLAGGSTLQFDCDGALARWSARAWNAVSRTMRWAAGSFIFVEASAFRRVGGFSTQLYAAEELEIGRAHV